MTVRPITLLIVSLIFSVQVFSQDFLEGEHYTRINDATTTKRSGVVEYFSFACPACFAIESHIAKLEKSLTDVPLKRVHVPFGGRQAIHAQKVFVLIEALGAHDIYQSVFSRIHEHKKSFTSDAEIIQFFEDKGYEGHRVGALLASFSTEMKIKSMNAEAKSQGITHIPTIIVNGKYHIDNRAIHSGTDLRSLVDYLIAKDTQHISER